MENPAEGLSEVVSGIDYARNVTHDDIAEGTPLLKAKVSSFDVVAGVISRAIMVDNLGGRVIVFIEESWGLLFVAEFQ